MKCHCNNSAFLISCFANQGKTFERVAGSGIITILLIALGYQAWIIRGQGYEIMTLRHANIANEDSMEDMRRKIIFNEHAELPPMEQVRFELVPKGVIVQEEGILNIYTADHLSLSYLIEEDYVGFMKRTGEEDASSFRAVFERYKDIDSFDYRDYLLDLKGDGDNRYLILASLCSGTAANMHGYLLDAKDDFSVVGRIPVRESISYPKHNPDLVFDFEDRIGSFGWDSGYISARLKIQKGKFPVWIQKDIDAFSFKKYEDALKPLSGSESDNLTKEEAQFFSWKREIVFDKLCCELFVRGELFKLENYAFQLGFKDEETKQFKESCMRLIRSSELYPYIDKCTPQRY